LAGETFQRLQQWARQEQLTGFMVLQGALCVFLHRLTGQQDIVLAVPVSGREHPDVEPLIGFFLNTLLLRHPVDRNRGFTELMQAVKQTTLQGLEHQHYPFEQLLDELSLPRAHNRFPVTPVIFNMLNFHERGEALSERSLRSSRGYNDMKTEFELDAYEYRNGVRFRAHYRTGLFRQETVEYLMAEFTGLIEQLLRAPDAPLHQHSVFAQLQSPGEYHWPQAPRSTYLEFQQGALEQGLRYHHVLEGVRRQVAARPQAIALARGETTLSYSELWRRVQILSQRLRDAGIKDGEVVGLLVSRPLERLIGLLSVMHAGCTVTPFGFDEPVQPAKKRPASDPSTAQESAQGSGGSTPAAPTGTSETKPGGLRAMFKLPPPADPGNGGTSKARQQATPGKAGGTPPRPPQQRRRNKKKRKR
jgi:non-ribosomal peptide synthetase component F